MTFAKRALLAGALLLAGLNAVSGRAFQPPIPSPDSIRLAHEEAVQVAGLMSLGMRRLAADIAFIRLLMYYGSAEGTHPEHHDHGYSHPHGEGAGGYLELAGRAIRILDLDPYFEYVVQYAAGALAFNLERPDDALAVLRHALARDPRNWKHHATLAAIGFHKRGDPAKVREQLAKVGDDPEAPTMLKHILAFLNRRLGRREDALRLYRQILASRDAAYHHFARQALRELGANELP